MSTQSIFGYGSLVNAATHDYGTLQVAELHGWRRQWHYTTLRDLAFLSVSPDDNASIKGVVMEVPPKDAALEKRESAYGRHTIGHQIPRHHGHRADTHVFAIPTTIHRPPDAKSTLLLSYIDVVVQGYFHMFGEDGAREFFDTTAGWGAQVINDRMAPIYPRPQKLSLEETAIVDDGLASLGATVVPA